MGRDRLIDYPSDPFPSTGRHPAVGQRLRGSLLGSTQRSPRLRLMKAG